MSHRIAIFALLSLALVGGCKEKSAAKKLPEPKASATPTAGAKEVREKPELAKTELAKTDESPANESRETSVASADDKGLPFKFPVKGRWTKEERKHFDKDGDGRLNRTERKSMHEARAKSIFETADLDGNGVITRADVQSATDSAGKRIRQRFSKLDEDGDGKLTPSELRHGIGRRSMR